MSRYQEYGRAWYLRNREQQLDYVRSYRLAHREEIKQRLMDRKALIAAVKLAQGCVDCGYKDNPVALDFDHLPGTAKKRSVSAMASSSEGVMWAEIEKCEVVCANCHRIRTSERVGA